MSFFKSGGKYSRNIVLMLFVTACKELRKKKKYFFTSDSYKVAHKALRLSPAVTAGCDFCLQGSISVFKDLSLNYMKRKEEKKKLFRAMSFRDLQPGMPGCTSSF